MTDSASSPRPCVPAHPTGYAIVSGRPGRCRCPPTRCQSPGPASPPLRRCAGGRSVISPALTRSQRDPPAAEPVSQPRGEALSAACASGAKACCSPAAAPGGQTAPSHPPRAQLDVSRASFGANSLPDVVPLNSAGTLPPLGWVGQGLSVQWDQRPELEVKSQLPRAGFLLSGLGRAGAEGWFPATPRGQSSGCRRQQPDLATAGAGEKRECCGWSCPAVPAPGQGGPWDTPPRPQDAPRQRGRSFSCCPGLPG